MIPILALTLAVLAQPVQVEDLAISHHARALTPGEIVLIDVRHKTPMRDVRATWLGQTLRFYEIAPTRWQGLAPIDLSVPPGRHTLTVTADAGGSEVAAEYVLIVVPKKFPVRRLKVAPSFATPPEDLLPRILREQATVEAIFTAPPGERLWSGPFTPPVSGKPTSSFGRRSIVNGEPRSPHSGADFQAAAGTRVVAPNRGRVAFAGDLYFAGRTVIIDHGGGLYSYLAHLSAIGVEEGALVERGQRIGLSGSTGRVTGPHLHWTVRLGTARVDPLSLIFLLAPRKG
jgi:murein DD-endopeptidase MepM/ murein hydrolase activator NlpD